jgi:hypothetical protein
MITKDCDMDVIRTRRATLAVVIVTTLCLASCHRSFVIRPTGRIGQSVTFNFYELNDPNTPARFDIERFFVQEQKRNGQWTSIWELSGKRVLEAIIYGDKYEGLAELAPALPFSRGTKYCVYASALSRFGPGGSSLAFFSFDQDGVLIVIDPSR